MNLAQKTVSTASKFPPHRPTLRNGRWASYTHLLWSHILILKREPEVIFWGFVFPLLLATGVGIAFRKQPGSALPVAIVQGAGAQDAMALLGRSPQHASFVVHSSTAEEAQRGLRRGRYDLVIETSGKGEFQYRYDPAQPESVLARMAVDDALQMAAGRKDVIATAAVSSTELGARYIDFLIPGLLGMNLMNSCMWGVGFSLVDMRQRKQLKRLISTPLRRTHILLALLSSRLLLMVFEFGALLGLGVLAFHMHVMGSLTAIVLLGTVGAITFGSGALLMACRAEKMESVSGLINLVMMPMWIFSGVFFSYERFPVTIQPLIKALPLTEFNDALRASILEGTSLPQQWLRLALLGLWGGVSFLLALKWFRWT